MSRSVELPASNIPIFTTISGYREWRREALYARKSVGFVPTMGALHEGHATLVRQSLADNELTVVSIFVNPAQFAPHEDLATYPRTLPHDLETLSTLSHTIGNTDRTPSAVFLPSVKEMYPSGITQNVADQKGTFVEVKGYSHQMEGGSRPTFFRGVATVVTKLFNIIEPTRAYFGQKDVQQAFLLRRMTLDLLLSHPSPENLHIVPTARDPMSSLALSSRNAYLTSEERERAAPLLYAALRQTKLAWEAGKSKEDCITIARAAIESKALDFIQQETGIHVKLDYIEMNDPETFEVVPDSITISEWDEMEDLRKGRPVILSGAMWVGKTRLIDNIILGDESSLGILSG